MSVIFHRQSVIVLYIHIKSFVKIDINETCIDEQNWDITIKYCNGLFLLKLLKGKKERRKKEDIIGP
jgi:hypothetical protein